MYLSKLGIGRDLSDPGMIRVAHGLVYDLFGGEGTHMDRSAPGSSSVLFRISEDHILIQSATKPSPAKDLKTKRFEIPSRTDLTYDFFMVASPTMAEFKRGSKRGRVRSIGDLPGQRAWLDRKASQGGFTVLDLAIGESVRVVEYVAYKNPVQFGAVPFLGRLRITDPEAFRKTFTAGIGRHRAWGCGMMSLALTG